MRLENKVAIITGAGGGIGGASAIMMAKEGAKIVVTDIDCPNGKKTVETIKANGGEAIFMEHDIRSEDAWKSVVEQAEKTFGKVDVLVNSAGYCVCTKLLETTLEEYNSVIEINQVGCFLGMKSVIPAMIRNKGGSIINISANGGLMVAGNLTAYAASKAAIRSMTHTAAAEHGKQDIRVNAIYPGFVKTQMLYGTSVGREAGADPDDNIPTLCLNRIGIPEDIGYLVIYLASDESYFATAADFVIDGGWMHAKMNFD